MAVHMLRVHYRQPPPSSPMNTATIVTVRDPMGQHPAHADYHSSVKPTSAARATIARIGS